ncbi:MAG: thiamine phosphate synthase [Planctomycetes bacterium]|nr:thiamine phosphate synthase [Planctomycetota bacterium]
MRDVYRILDANLNRAREAMRVAEEYGRFVLNDARLASMAKTMRSELQQIAASLPAAALLAARNTAGDVGTALTSPTESVRPTAAATATAACKRLTEALRAIEEYAKVVAPAAAVRAEALRYRGYAFEQVLLSRADRLGRFARTHLYVLLTTSLCKADPLVTAHAALAGGADCIQLREKALGDRPLLDLARRLREITAQAGALLIINDRPDIAAVADADGVHVGQDDLPVDAVRAAIGGDRLVGLSTHSVDQARRAAEAGADYIGIGPMFATATKDAGPIQGPSLVCDVLAAVDLPHVAIGGITAANAPALARAGARCIAVCSAVLGADDPQAAAAAIKASFMGAMDAPSD